MGAKNKPHWWHRIPTVARRFVPAAESGQGLLGIAILVIVLLTAAYAGWSKWGNTIGKQPQYVLTPESFEITPQPDWIQSDVKAEVVRDGQLAELSALDPDLISRVVQAFELNTWVAKVVWAGKRAGSDGPRVIVKIRYRRPIIWVRTYDDRWPEGDCFYPVDTEGVFLPPAEFSESQIRDFLRVDAGNTPPVGAVGTPYGDAGVSGAASIAAKIGPEWKSLGLQWIVVRKTMPPEIGQSTDITYVLLPVGGDPDLIPKRDDASLDRSTKSDPMCPEVFWGHAPGQEGSGEATAAQKVARLRMYVEQNGPLDRLAASTLVDLRHNAAISIRSRRSQYQPASTR
ncbi:MAG: hypothetical protein ACQESR_21175 [Planctomycetota bacterium]